MAMSRQLNEISISKLNQSMSADVVIPKMGSVATVDVGKHNEGAFRVLPSDEGFSWARDDYSTTQRQIDVWSFVLTLRARVWFLDSKWTYLGGFTEEKQVSAEFLFVSKLIVTSESVTRKSLGGIKREKNTRLDDYFH